MFGEQGKRVETALALLLALGCLAGCGKSSDAPASAATTRPPAAEETARPAAQTEAPAAEPEEAPAESSGGSAGAAGDPEEYSFYATVSAVEGTGGPGCRIRVTVLTWDTFDDGFADSLSPGDSFTCRGVTYTVESLEEKAMGRIFLDNWNMLCRNQSDGQWVLCWPSGSIMYREDESLALDVRDDARVLFDPLLLQIYGEEIEGLALEELFSEYGEMTFYPCEIDMENGLVTRIRFDYRP